MLLNKEEEFIKENIGLVHLCCKKFVGKGYEYDDIFQVGSMGLLKAARDFDACRGCMFSTYAIPVILGEIKRLFRDNGAIKVSRSLKELSLKVSRVSENYEKQNGAPPSVSYLADAFGVTLEEINEALDVARPVMSLTCENDNGEKQGDVPIVDDNEQISDRLIIQHAIKDLSHRDKSIIKYRYFEGLTQAAVAKRLNMTQVQVSRREKKILSEMRLKIGEYN